MKSKLARPLAFYIPNLDGGGAQKVMVELVNSLATIQNMPVHLVVARADGYFSTMVSDRVSLIELGCNRASRSIFPLRSYIKRENPLVIMSTLNYANVILVISKILSNCNTSKVILREANIFVPRSNSLRDRTMYFTLKILMRLFYSKANMFIANSKDTLNSIVDSKITLPTSKSVIYNPITMPDFNKCRNNDSEFNFDYICAAGRLTQQKGFDFLIRSFAKIKDKKIKLLICGEGEDRKDLTKLISHLNLEDRVVLLGFHDDFLSVLSKAKMFILSSRWEGFGNVIVEALSLGVPVISTSCLGGPIEILDSGKYGYLVEVDNEKQMTLAIDSLSDEKKYESDALISRASDFSVDTISRQYLNFMLK